MPKMFEKLGAFNSHHEGYASALEKVRRQSVEEDIELIDLLFGRGNLSYGDSDDDVKREALRQLEIEWRIPE